jgi:hypothetical protein
MGGGVKYRDGTSGLIGTGGISRLTLRLLGGRGDLSYVLSCTAGDKQIETQTGRRGTGVERTQPIYCTHLYNMYTLKGKIYIQQRI